MLTERAHEMSKQAIKCACLMYALQDELDAFKEEKECKHRLKKWVNDLLFEVSTEIEHIFAAGSGLCTEGQFQYTEITNKMLEELPTFGPMPKYEVSKSERLVILCKQLEIESERLKNLSDKICYQVHPKIISLLKKVAESIEINISSRRIAELVTLHLKACDATLTFFIGSYSEQVQAIQEYHGAQ